MNSAVVASLLSLAGVVLGAAVAAVFSHLGEVRRWRRDWLFDEHRRRSEFYLEAVTALDREFIVLSQVVNAQQGRRLPIPQDRIRAADEDWRLALSRGLILASEDVQEAMHQFDLARAACVDEVNANNRAGLDQALSRVEDRRGGLLETIRQQQLALAPHLVRRLQPLPVRLWRRLLGHPIDYL